MADLRISELPVLSQADAEANDDIAVADYSSSETRRLTVKGLVQQGVVNLIDNGVIPGAKIVTDSITATQIAADAVTASELADDAVDTAAIVDAAVTGAKIATDTITATNIAANAVTASELADNSVDTAAIVNAAVTGTKIAADTITAANIAADAVTASELADNAVDTAAIVDLNVTTVKIADDAVTTAKIATNAVTINELADDSVDTAAIVDAAVTGAKIATDTITATNIAADAVGASELADDAVDTAAIQNLAVTAAKIATDTITATQIAPDAITASELADNAVDTAAIVDAAVTSAKIALNTITADNIATDAVNTDEIAASAVTTAKIADLNITTGKLADGAVTAAKISTDTITSTQIAANAVTASELADSAVDTAAVVNGAITGVKIAADTITADNIAANAVTASELADDAVDTASILNSAVTGAKIATDTVTAANIAASAVTSSELADNAVTTNKIVDAAVTDIKLATGIDGAKLSSDTVTAAKIPSASLDRGLDKTSGSIGITNAITPGTRNGITFTAQGLISSTAALVAADLPLSTTTTVGGVIVAADSGLSISGAGEISITNSVTADTVSGITFDEFGSITAAVALTGTDLPLSTTTTVGGVIIPSSGGLEIDGSGNVIIPDSGVIAGEYTKVTVNSRGIVTTATQLSDTDIPEISASLLTSGTMAIARLANNSITGPKLSNSSVCQFGGSDSTAGVVTFPTADYAGQFFFDSINSDLYIWDGNAWQPVTITSGEIIFAGTYDAGTNLIASVTTQGQAAGLTAGSALPAASADNRQYYLVVSEIGTGTAPAPSVGLNPPDILLSSGTDWELLDVSSFVASQLASNISFVPFGDIQSTNVQTALQEVSTEKLAKSGGTMSGDLEIGAGASLIFEGATDDGFETTIAITDPTTADCTITLPNRTGTVITTGDTGTVTSTMITDGTIVNGDINASAAIAFSKLAALTSAYILVGNGSNVATAVPVTGDIGIDNTGATSITAGAIVNADINAGAAISASKIQAATTSNAGVVQLNNTVSSTSTSLAATANAVKTAYDLAALALPKAGGTISGELLIGATGSLVFEGATDDTFETTLAVTDPTTADRTITLPNATGTVALTSQLDDGSY